MGDGRTSTCVAACASFKPSASVRHRPTHVQHHVFQGQSHRLGALLCGRAQRRGCADIKGSPAVSAAAFAVCSTHSPLRLAREHVSAMLAATVQRGGSLLASWAAAAGSPPARQSLASLAAAALPQAARQQQWRPPDLSQASGAAAQAQAQPQAQQQQDAGPYLRRRTSIYEVKPTCRLAAAGRGGSRPVVRRVGWRAMHPSPPLPAAPPPERSSCPSSGGCSWMRRARC